MKYMTYFYVAIDILLVVYACYSWYWQAKVDFRGRYRISSVVWALIFIWLGFTWNYIEKGDPGLRSGKAGRKDCVRPERLLGSFYLN